MPPGSLVAGVPAKVGRPLTDEERADMRANAEVYVDLARQHAAALGGPTPTETNAAR